MTTDSSDLMEKPCSISTSFMKVRDLKIYFHQWHVLNIKIPRWTCTGVRVGSVVCAAVTLVCSYSHCTYNSLAAAKPQGATD